MNTEWMKTKYEIARERLLSRVASHKARRNRQRRIHTGKDRQSFPYQSTHDDCYQHVVAYYVDELAKLNVQARAYLDYVSGPAAGFAP